MTDNLVKYRTSAPQNIGMLWRREGLKVPRKQPKRGRVWLNDGSIIRLKPEIKKHVWRYDFIHNRTHNGAPLRILNVIDEYTRECLAVRVARRLSHKDVMDVLYDMFCERGVPDCTSSKKIGQLGR